MQPANKAAFRRTTIHQLFKSLLYVASACVLLVSSTNSALAFTGEEGFSLNNIPPYVNKDAVACDETDGGITSETGVDNMGKIFNFFLAKGLSPLQAAGAVGNISIESNGASDPTIVERNSSHPELPKSTDDPAGLPIVGGWPGGQTRQPGWGLIQWTPASKYITISKAIKVEAPHNLDAQLKVIWYHMTDTTPTGVKNFRDEYSRIVELGQATQVFMVKFLAPHASTNHYEERLAAAKSALSQYGNNNPAAAVNDNGCFVGGSFDDEIPGVPVSGDGSAIINTALKYAWPTKKHTPKMTPAYAKAIREAKARGENVNGWGRSGSSNLDGLDCHIYVKRVLRDSGADTSYSTDMSIPMAVEYMRKSSKYKEYRPTSAEDLSPGTVIAYNNGSAPGQPGRHMFLYVGPNSYLEGGNKSTEASISPTYSPQSAYTTPMAGAYKSYMRYFKVVNSVDGAM